MTNIPALAEHLLEKAGNSERFMVAIAGPPGSGKTTLAETLCQTLVGSGETAVVVPMDGFHFDDTVLKARGHRSRKGAPHTFDVSGFHAMLKRIKAREAEIAIPVFDRKLELSRGSADIINESTRFILVEGLYLLLKQEPWAKLYELFDYSLSLMVPQAELERRLINRWLDHGFDEAYARNWIATNDSLNMKVVVEQSRPAKLAVTN